MTKKSKHPLYDDPTAFKAQFPRIEKLAGGSTALSRLTTEESYKMGAIRAAVNPPGELNPGYFMSVHGTQRYPSWDEIVWLRYNLLPDAAVMSLILPNLNVYINKDDTGHKFVFTMEQKGWALDPVPTCDQCQHGMNVISIEGITGRFGCESCGNLIEVNCSTWNEEHGNGFHGSQRKKSR